MRLRLRVASRFLSLAALLWLLAPLPASAVPVLYGDFVGDGFMLLDVMEDSDTDPTPLFGAPQLMNGTMLEFSPMSFDSSAQNGTADITNATLSATVMASPGLFIEQIVISEGGDYTLMGLSGEATAAAGGTAFLDLLVLELNGMPVDPINVVRPFEFAPSGGMFELSDEGIVMDALWSGGVSIDLVAAVAQAGFPGARVTKLDLVINNTLATASQMGTAAHIQKKDFETVVATAVIPEPGTLFLVGSGLLGLGVFGRSKRG